jgi:hypothetical protein
MTDGSGSRREKPAYARPFFSDSFSRSLEISARSTEEAIVRTAMAFFSLDGSANANVYYNGYYLLSERLIDRALQLQEHDALVGARFLRDLIVAQTNQPVPPLADADRAILARFIPPEFVKEYDRLQRRAAIGVELQHLHYPQIHAQFADVDASLESFVFSSAYKPTFGLDRDTLIVTMGSCFAGNIASHLGTKGLKVVNLASAEEASPATFPDLVERLQQDEDHAASLRQIRDHKSVCVIFTAGIGLMVRLKNGDFLPQASIKAVAMRSVTAVLPAEPADISRRIGEGLAAMRRINPNCTMVCTVSPVPIGAAFVDRAGIIVSNSVSKAALLLGVQELARTAVGVAYFPSYEIVKEWAPLAGVQPFSADDGHPRHVNGELVEIICAQFMKRFFGETAVGKQ